jgi:hypothetical protein
VARVLVSPFAADDLERMIATHSLPAGTRERVRPSIRPLERFPRLGASLGGRWSEYRFILGPWRWMLIVYEYDAAADLITIATIQDGRTAQWS